MSGEPNTALDLLEEELFREARLHLEPDQARVESLWQSVAAASVLGVAVSGVSASVPPASGTGWATPKPLTTSPSAAPAPTAAAPTVPTPAPTAPPLATVPPPAPLLAPVAPTTVSFGLRALLGAAVGGALLGFAVGYGSGARNALDPPGAVTKATSQASSAANGNDSNASRAATAEAGDATKGVPAVSGADDEPQAPAATRAGSAKPPLVRLDAIPSPSLPIGESPKPSFYEELEYLRRAQSALREGNGALALGLMSSLDSIQPGGALLSERGVVRVLAHCQLGDVASAERVAQGLADHGLASVYAERLETSCAGAVLAKP